MPSVIEKRVIELDVPNNDYESDPIIIHGIEWRLRKKGIYKIDQRWILLFDVMASIPSDVASEPKHINEFSSMYMEFQFIIYETDGTSKIIEQVEKVLDVNFENFEYSIPIDNLVKVLFENNIMILDFHIGIRKAYLLDDFKTETPLTDVVLIVEGRELYVHRNILAHHSSYFQVMFYRGFREAHQKRITLKDIDLRQFVIMLNIIYGNLIIVEEDCFKEIINFAQYFTVPSIEATLRKQVIWWRGIRGMGEFVDKLQIAEDLEWTELENECWNILETSGIEKVAPCLRSRYYFTKFSRKARDVMNGKVKIEPNTESFNNFSSEDDCTDITLIIDSERLYVSKSMLAVNSTYFKEKFYKQPKLEEICIEVEDFEEFITFLNVVYKNTFDINDENFKYLLEIAERFECDYVKNLCEMFMLSRQLPLFESLTLADQYSLEKLKHDTILRMHREQDFLIFLDVFKSFRKSTKSDVIRRIDEVLLIG